MFIERSYLLQLSNRFRNFKQKNNLFNFSCPYCGDSTKNKFKARGYMIERKASYSYYCHNCHVSRSFDKFLEEQDTTLYQQYKMEKLKDSSNLEKSVEIYTPNVKTSDFPSYRKSGHPLRKLKKVSQLNWDHPVKKYILERKIPNRYHAKLFYCPKFYAWTNTVIPGKFKEVIRDEARLVIPFIDEDEKMFGYQGRALSAGSALRYITIMVDEDRPKLYGLDDLSFSKRVYVCEGPFDSMFVDNCIAMAGSDAHIPSDIDNVVYIFDNEPRNKAIVDKMERSINQGYNIVVWPNKIEYKDMNDMIMSGYSKADLKLIIDQNTCSGLEAKMRMSVWKKV